MSGEQQELYIEELEAQVAVLAGLLQKVENFECTKAHGFRITLETWQEKFHRCPFCKAEWEIGSKQHESDCKLGQTLANIPEAATNLLAQVEAGDKLLDAIELYLSAEEPGAARIMILGSMIEAYREAKDAP